LNSESSLFKGVAWALAAVLSWGPMFPLAKRTLTAIDPFALGSIRYLIGVTVLVALLWALEGRRSFSYSGRLAAAAALGVIGIAGFNVLVWIGLAWTRPEHTTIILSLQAPLAALAVWLLRGQRPARFTLGCIALAFAGVLLVITRGEPLSALGTFGASGGELLGDLLVFLGGASWVAYGLGGGSFAGWSALRFTTLTGIPGAIGLCALNVAAVAAGYAHVPSADALVSHAWQIGYFSLVSVVLGVFAFNAAVKHIGPLDTTLLLNLVPVTVFGIEAALGRSFARAEIVGAALVIAALVANNLYLRRRQRAR
jgi:drug/metabolite transporter (DMT)-like permease